MEVLISASLDCPVTEGRRLQQTFPSHGVISWMYQKKLGVIGIYLEILGQRSFIVSSAIFKLCV